MTHRQLALASETSERYLAQIESGAGNPSASVIRAIAQALDCRPSRCCRRPARARRRSTRCSIFSRKCRKASCRSSPSLSRPAWRVPQRRPGAAHCADWPARRRQVDARRMLAQHLGWPFIELDRVVEEDYGASIPDLIEMAGTATFRRHEKSALERVIAAHEAAVITTAGGIVATRRPMRCCFAAATRSGSRRGRKIT